MFKKFGFDRHNEVHLNARRGLVSLLLSIVSLGIPLFGLILAPLFFVAFVQFMHTVTKRPMPMDKPFFVRRLDDLKIWWDRYSQPLQSTKRGGERIFVRRTCSDYCEYYDRNGALIGVEQEVDWSMTDMDWQPGDPRPVNVHFTPAAELKSAGHLSWLALRRSHKALEDMPPVENLVSNVLNFAQSGAVTKVRTNGTTHQITLNAA